MSVPNLRSNGSADLLPGLGIGNLNHAAASNSNSNSAPSLSSVSASPSSFPSLIRPPVNVTVVSTLDRLGSILSRAMKQSKGSIRFDNSSSGYLSWERRFRNDLETGSVGLDLSDVIEAAGPVNDEANKMKQQAVFSMISQCVPDEALQDLSSMERVKKTGYEAWKLLRVKYVGDETAFKQRLENQFNTLIWNESESLESFLSRLDGVVVQMKSMGIDKGDESIKYHVKRGSLLRKDRAGRSFHAKIDVVSSIHSRDTLSVWMHAVKTAVQEMEEDAKIIVRGNSKGSIGSASSNANSSSSHHRQRNQDESEMENREAYYTGANMSFNNRRGGYHGGGSFC